MMPKYPVVSPKARSPILPDLDSPISYRSTRFSQSPEKSKADADSPTRNTNSSIYRPAKLLPYELRHHCLVYLEEQLYASAITLLNNLLIAGTSYPTGGAAAFIPPPHHIALISTLLVHPIHTTRASSERLQILSESFNFLQNLLHIVGPVNAHLDEAFIFKRSANRSRRSGRRGDGIEKRSPIDSEEEINSALADESSLWVRGQDFWQVVGWSLNCSVGCPRRWGYWRVWLEYMLDVLEADWKERSRLDDEGLAEHKNLHDSIAMRYIKDAGSSTGAVKRMVKAILADGLTDSLRMFPEIFEKETRERGEQAGMKRKADFKLELETDNYGDYINNEEVEDLDVPSSQQSQSLAPSADPYNNQDSSTSSERGLMGGPEAMVLRCRLLALLSLASHTLPESFIPISILYPIYHEMITPLPLPLFARLMSPASRPYLPDSALFSLAHAQLLRLLPKEAPKPATDELSQESLEDCFLPFAAATSSIDDNAKVSILVEVLLRIFVTNCPVSLTKAFVGAVERGVAAREAKCKPLKRGKMKGEGDLHWLKESGQRIGFLMEVLRKRKQ